MLGGRPLQDISAELHSDARAWTVRRLEFRAPGATRVSLSGASAAGAPPDGFKAALNAESSDPDVLMTWLQGRSDIAARCQKPFRLRGDVTFSPGGFAIDAMKAEIDGGALEGRVAVIHRGANSGSRVDAELKAERLDLDAATAFVRSWPGRMPNGRTRCRCRSTSAAPSRPGRSSVRLLHKAWLRSEIVLAGPAEDRPAMT